MSAGARTVRPTGCAGRKTYSKNRMPRWRLRSTARRSQVGVTGGFVPTAITIVAASMSAVASRTAVFVSGGEGAGIPRYQIGSVPNVRTVSTHAPMHSKEQSSVKISTTWFALKASCPMHSYAAGWVLNEALGGRACGRCVVAPAIATLCHDERRLARRRARPRSQRC